MGVHEDSNLAKCAEQLMTMVNRIENLTAQLESEAFSAISVHKSKIRIVTLFGQHRRFISDKKPKVEAVCYQKLMFNKRRRRMPIKTRSNDGRLRLHLGASI